MNRRQLLSFGLLAAVAPKAMAAAPAARPAGFLLVAGRVGLLGSVMKLARLLWIGDGIRSEIRLGPETVELWVVSDDPEMHRAARLAEEARRARSRG